MKSFSKLVIDNEYKAKFQNIKFITNKKINKNNTKHKKAKTNIIKKINSFKNIDNTESINTFLENNKENYQNNLGENIIKKIKENKGLFEKITYLQLWWKTIFQIIKIQKYLRGFLYRVKLLKMLELKEKIVYGSILLSKIIKKYFYKNLTKLIEDKKNQKKKIYFNIWNNFIIKKSIIQKLKNFDKKKIIHKIMDKPEKNKTAKKLKSESVKKREKHKVKNKNVIFIDKMPTLEKSLKKENLGEISKRGPDTSRISTEKKSIHNLLGFKNNSMEKRSKKNIFNDSNNKNPCKFYKTSNNLLMNKSQNQIQNYKFNNKNNIDYKFNQNKLSKKNTNFQKYKKINKNRNKKTVPGIFDTNLNKFKSYNVESSRNKVKNNITKNTNQEKKLKKNSQLEYISTHENRFHCPKQIYYLNKNNLKKSPSINIEKLNNSFQNNNENIDSSNIKNADNNNNNIRAKSLESRHNKKFKSFVQNINNINNDNLKNDENLNKNNSNCDEILKNEKNEKSKKIKKSQTKILKKTKKKKNQKGILKNSKKENHKLKNKKSVLPWLNKWKMKNIKKQIINKLRCISILINKIKIYLYKENANLLIKSLKNIQKNKIILNNFNIYRNIIFSKIIIQKLKEKYSKKKEEEEERVLTDNNVDKEDNENIGIKDDNENFNNINEKKINIIEISPYQDTKINSKIKNNKIKIESKIKLQKLIIIKQKINDYSILKKYFLKWKNTIQKFEQNYNPGCLKILDCFNLKANDNNEIQNEQRRNNSSYHRKRVKYHQNNNNDEISFNEEKLYNRKIVNYFSNKDNISLNKDDYFNKSQPKINNYDNFNKINEYNNLHHKYNISDFITSPQNYNSNNLDKINYNFIANSPIQGVYKKKRIINSKNSNINKNSHNMSCIIGEINKSNFGLNNSIENENEKEFLNNSMVMRHRKIKNNYNDIYIPKHVSPNLIENESDFDMPKVYIKEQTEFYSNKKNMANNNIAYKKMNIRYQKMYYENDLNSEHRQINYGILEEQTNEGTN